MPSGTRSPALRARPDAVPSRRLAWIATDRGLVRPNNEDRCFAAIWRSDGADGAWAVPLGSSNWSAAVADGMGGHQAGELASETVVAYLQPQAGDIDGDQAAKAVLEDVNQHVFEAMHSSRGRPGMGSTVAGVTVRDEVAVFYNVGDSRSYILRGAHILRQSVDHTLGGGPSSRARSHLLTQSLGGTSRRTLLAPNVTKAHLIKGDTILLCSDGLTDMLSEEEISDVFLRHVGNPAAALVSAAVDAGGHDNVTVIIIGEI